MGQWASIVAQMFPGNPTWTASHVPDLTGKVTIVTGGNTGTGRETAKALLEKNAKVYMAARSRERAEVAIAELKTITGREAFFLECDLADLSSVRRAAATFSSIENELHVLFNNAGVMWTPSHMLTKDGYDVQWGTNVIGHWLLMVLLVPALERGADSSPDRHSRVVFTASSGVYFDPVVYFDTFVPGPGRDKKSRYDLYNQSKVGNCIIAREAARRYAEKNIVVTSVNPGNIRTELTRHTTAWELWFIRWIQYPAAFGALPQLYAGTSHETVDKNGKFFVPWSREGKLPAKIVDSDAGTRLWEWLVADIGNKGFRIQL